MTAEVAVMNREAVALAADSAGTVTGPFGQKIYNSINKLFALSKFHPIGIMVYSSSQVMGMPAETAIKAFRKKLGNSELDTVKDYADEFRKFLEQDMEVFPKEARREQCRQVAVTYLEQIAEHQAQKLEEIFAEDDADGAYKEWRSLLLKELRRVFAEGPEVENISTEIRAETQAIIQAITAEFKKILHDASFPIGGEDLKNLEWLSDAFLFREGRAKTTKSVDIASSETGFAIAGFGKKQYFPAIEAFELVYSLDGTSRYKQEVGGEVGPGNPSGVMPFAQKDMIETFMEGRARVLDEVLYRAMQAFFEQHAEVIANEIKPGAHDPVLQARLKETKALQEGLLGHFLGKMDEWTKGQYMPTLQTLEFLPKEDLAVIAEALVSLTIHKRRASADAETVGPPVDVAVISKGDGFIWMKRKHYFEKDLNPQFFQNYNRGV